jgi:hypothetical protein
VRNPNGCPARGTFFVQKDNTDFSVVKGLYDKGHEIGATSADGVSPDGGAEWRATLQGNIPFNSTQTSLILLLFILLLSSFAVIRVLESLITTTIGFILLLISIIITITTNFNLTTTTMIIILTLSPPAVKTQCLSKCQTFQRHVRSTPTQSITFDLLN